MTTKSRCWYTAELPGNYSDDRLIMQPSQLSQLKIIQSSSMDLIVDTLDDNYVLREKMLGDMCTATLLL